MVLVVLPGFSAAAAQDVERPGTELAGVVLETWSEDLAHAVAGHAGHLVAVVVPGAERDDCVLADLLLAVQVAEVAVVNLGVAALDGALEASSDAPAADDAAECTRGVLVGLLGSGSGLDRTAHQQSRQLCGMERPGMLRKKD
ncbi:hypothetical protein [Xanthomonas sp. BRIP62411]|uniref:hypothetical protein n=1 Tax=Xanthomonas sp. BRIP62411 TaxID=2182389 RepID=UPI0013DEA055|nr:hypothetical protein [Xanthomonas sp. BRIP62411]